MKQIAFSGTLDPITNGHMWVIAEARSLADEVTIFLSENTQKKPQFPAEERKRIIELSAAEKGWDNIKVVIVKGDYTARVAKKRGIHYLIRGIRNTSDFDYENLIQQTNADVLNGSKTIFVIPPRDLGSVSSSFVRTLLGPVGWHWNVKKFVPGPAYHAWVLDWLRKDWDTLWQGPSAAERANADHWFSVLTGPTSYGSAERHYHNLDHLVHGLTEIGVWARRLNASEADANTLKKAFWFHDAVYGQEKIPGQVSDEEASAHLWLQSGLDATAAAEVADLIRATDHFQAPNVQHPLKNAMLGVDLAILGQEEDIYDIYAAAIRAEYPHVTDTEYRAKRRGALVHLHGKAKAGLLYPDPYFADYYNDAAISNMAREITTL